MEKILVLAYPGSGKTYLADNFQDVSDFEFQHYRYDYGEYKHLPLEQLKGRTEIRTDNPNWPENFFIALDKEIKKRRIVLVPFATSLLEILKYLEKTNSVRIIFAIQDRNLLEKLIEGFKSRGNSEEFIERRRNDFQKCHEIILNSRFEKVYITENEFLHDALKKIGIKFEKGKGFKNYI
jgi:adenylate kinase family enzyme